MTTEKLGGSSLQPMVRCQECAFWVSADHAQLGIGSCTIATELPIDPDRVAVGADGGWTLYTGPDFGCVLGKSKMTLRDNPYVESPQIRAIAHATVEIVSTLQNSIDGTGPWIGVHLLDPSGNFIQGGWMLA